MKKAILILFFILPFFTYSQDTLLTYTKVLTFDSISKGNIFDKALIWCSKSFKDSKSAINVKERDGGIISGKAIIDNYYYIHKNKNHPEDSTLVLCFNDYKFDWLIEVKDNKLRFSISNLNYYRNISNAYSNYDIDYPVTTSEKPPHDLTFISTEKIKLYWKLSKENLFKKLDLLMKELNEEIKTAKPKDDW